MTNALAYSIDDPDVIYQLNKRCNTLLKLCVLWDTTVKIISIEQNLSWGNQRIWIMMMDYDIGTMIDKLDIDTLGYGFLKI